MTEYKSSEEAPTTTYGAQAIPIQSAGASFDVGGGKDALGICVNRLSNGFL